MRRPAHTSQLSTITTLVLPLIAGCSFSSGASDILVRFSELSTGVTYRVSSTFTSGGINCEVEPFQWSGGQWTSNGAVRVQSGGLSGVGAEPPYLWLGNVNVRFDLGVATDIRLQYGAFGGNQNLRINGAITNFPSMAWLDGATLGTARLLLKGSGNTRGELQIIGIITDFAIGGQEFALDDICISPYSGPKFRHITLGPGDQLVLVFSYPGIDPAGLVLKYTTGITGSPEWLADPRATILATGENWFEARTVLPTGIDQAFYVIGRSGP